MILHEVRALVVDDEPMNLIVANSIFSGYGMKVDTAGSGPEAIDLCSKNKYDIVFMDHMMPAMDGVEAMKRIRANMRGRTDTAIVALTANTVSMAREMFIREGFDGFIGKPIETLELERTLRGVLPDYKISYEQIDEERERANAMTPVASPEPSPVVESSSEFTGAGTAGDVAKAYESLKVYGLDAEIGLQYCQGDESLYQAILVDFAEGAADMVQYLDEKLIEEDMKGYEIKIHSMKSTSRMVGALDVGDVAERLELAASENRIDDVRREHNQAITLYSGVTEAIREFYRD